MKRYIFSLLLAVFAVAVQAQDVVTENPVAVVQQPTATVGYFSYREVLISMSDYALAEKQMDDLREKYAAELKRVQDEFNAKYEEFLDGMKDFPPTILKKRQTEIQELMEKNVAFKDESRRLLAEAENAIFAPLHERISQAMAKLGDELGLVVILNTDSDACPYINPSRSIDVTTMLKEKLLTY